MFVAVPFNDIAFPIGANNYRREGGDCKSPLLISICKRLATYSQLVAVKALGVLMLARMGVSHDGQNAFEA
jgi:hypothetical protein